MSDEHQPLIASSSQSFPPSVQMRSYLSTHQLWGARHFAALAQQIEDGHVGRSKFSIRQRTYVSGAVLSACAFLEATVNELFQDVADDHESYIGPLSPQAHHAFKVYWDESGGRAELLSKYQIALGLAGCQPFETSAEPFQSTRLLVLIRNLLMHFRPQTAGDGETKLEAHTRSHFGGNRMMAGAGNPFWPDKCLGAECANWAVASAKTFADEAFRRLNLLPNYQRALPSEGAE